MRPLVRALTLLTIYLCFAGKTAAAGNPGGAALPAAGGRPAAPADSSPAAAAGTGAARSDAEAALAETQARLRALPETEREGSPVKREESLLQQLLLVLSQQERTDKRSEEMTRKLAAPLPTPEIQAGGDLFPVADRLRGDLIASLAEQTQLKTWLAEAERSRDEEQQNLERLKRSLRQRDDAGGAAEGSGDNNVAAREIQLSEQRIKLSEKNKVAIARQQEFQRRVGEHTRNELAKLSAKVRFSEAELDQQIAGIKKERERLSRELRSLGQQLDEAEKKLASLPANADPQDPAQFEERLSYQTARDSSGQRTAVITERLNRLTELQDLWASRYKVFQHVLSRDELRALRARTGDFLKSLERSAQRMSLRSVEIRRELLRLKERSDSYAESTPVSQWVNATRRSLEAMIQQLDDVFLEIDADQLFTRKLLSEIEEQISTPTLGDRFGHFVSSLSTIWSYELLTTSDDRPITVKKLALLLVFLFLAVALSRRLSRMLGKKFFPRFGISSGAAAALESLAYYTFAIFFALLGLHFANIPLTLFTVLGGAFAIGVGFGSQAVLNNFMSSLILLIEQIVRPGDLIELDGRQGQIRRIGARSTTLHTSDNIDIIVPNSDLLQKHVINWTLNDARVRIHVEVTSFKTLDFPGAEAELLTIAREHPAVLNHPQAEVTLKSFTETSLVLELHAWILLDSFFQVEQVKSDLKAAALVRQTKQ